MGRERVAAATGRDQVKIELDSAELDQLITALDHYIAYLKARDRDSRPHEAILAKLRKARGTRK